MFFRSQGSLKPVPTPRTKTPLAQVCVCMLAAFFHAWKTNHLNMNNYLQFQGLQHSNSSSSSKGMDVSQSMPLYLFSCLLVLLLTHSQLILLIECERRSNGCSEEPEVNYLIKLSLTHFAFFLIGEVLSIYITSSWRTWYMVNRERARDDW